MVFELHPDGIMLLDDHGAILEANQACEALLGSLLSDARSSQTCCEVLGCRTPGSALEQGCLKELSDNGAAPRTEIRVDLPDGAPVTAVWVKAAPFQVGAAKVIVELRPGDRRDRRRRSSPNWSPPRQLEIFTLGQTVVNSPSGALGGPWLHHRAGKLLKYLVCERRRAVNAEEIAETLWPNGDQRVVNNVRYFIHTLRMHLEPTRAKRAPSRFILSEPGGYRLNPETVTVDADQFARDVQTGLERLRQGDIDAADVILTEGIRLYGGDFLPEERYALWAFGERERLRDLASDALWALADIRRRSGDLGASSAHLDRLADMHPFDPDLQRDTILLALRIGRHTVARRRYAALRRRMLQEFGSEPAFTLADLFAELEGDAEPKAPVDWRLRRPGSSSGFQPLREPPER